MGTTIGWSILPLSCTHDRIESEWLRGRPAAVANTPWETVPADRVREVPRSVRDDAVKLLASNSVQRLAVSELQHFGWNEPLIQGRIPFLMRAVTTASGNGTFEVLTNDQSVAIIYRALSRSAATEKSAVIVSLSEVPEAVYVEVSIAR